MVAGLIHTVIVYDRFRMKQVAAKPFQSRSGRSHDIRGPGIEFFFLVPGQIQLFVLGRDKDGSAAGR
jgi:hypothetical protein